METWIESETLYEGKIVTLKRGRVRLGNGQEAEREIVEHDGAVVIAPKLGDSVVMVRQYRVALGKELLELPAGKLEGDEEPVHRGRVELEEETGYRAGRMLPAGHFYPSCGFLTEKLYLSLAFDLEKTEQRLEWDENIEVVEMPLSEARERLRTHTFEDAKTIIGLHALFAQIQTGTGG